MDPGLPMSSNRNDGFQESGNIGEIVPAGRAESGALLYAGLMMGAG